MSRSSRSTLSLAAVVAAAATLLAACSSTSTTAVSSVASAAAPGSSTGGTAAAGAAPAASTAAGTLRLGYFANVTHAAAVLGVADGTFAKSLGSTKLETQVFNAGPAAIEALNANAIDAAFLGPSPAINSYVKSKGESLRIVAGATANGASLVVKPDITSVAQLKGKTIATPQLGGTQDVALREYLFKAGLKVQTNGGSDVDVVNQDNSQTLDLFKSGQVDGAWLPEPWASRLVLDAGAKTLVDETSLWPNKQFPTTILTVGKKFLDEHPDTVRALVSGELSAINEINADPAKSSAAVNDAIGKLTGKKLSDAVIASSFKNIKVTDDPLVSTYNASSQHAVGGLLKTVPDISGIVDLRILNGLLKASGKAPVAASGLGKE